MKCPNCSKEIANDNNFCEYCGKKITKLHTDLPYGDGDDNGNIRKLIFALSLCAGAIVVIVIILFTRANSCQPSVIEPIPGYPMVWIEGGKFIRRDISAQPDEDNYTSNSDSIEISGFYMGRYELSQEIWEQVMGTTNPSYHSDNPQNPVENVTFKDVITFINKANTQYQSQLGNRRFSLPTEAEWEFAAGDGIYAWDINMKMVWVEGGDFLMGCTSEQSFCDSDEQNVRRVTLDGFYIGMLEVTQAQWEKVVGTSVYQQRDKKDASLSMHGVGPDYPMYYVSWEEAMEFCRLLSNKTGKTYTLPTEAQWEYAARGGNRNEGTKYAGNDTITYAFLFYSENLGSTRPCGTKEEGNAWGIYDMLGNVFEWCKDWYSDSYLSYDTINPTGPSSGSDRVLRGGSWYDNASYCRVAFRGKGSPCTRTRDLGFRVVCLP